MTFASIIVPAFNVEKTLSETMRYLCAQYYPHYEIIIVDDGSTDKTHMIASDFAQNENIRLIRQANRGLAGARNSGIAASRGSVIGFCDADDLWLPGKLSGHVRHLKDNPHVGVSFSGSTMIDDESIPLGQSQRPRLSDIDPAHIFKRNPIGNGSAPVIRKDVFEDIAFRPSHERERDWYFDETFRQSEDIECWLRIALSTDWEFEGIADLLTLYRISNGGLSAATDRQLAAWEAMVNKLHAMDPDFFTTHSPVARAYQLRYLSRRAVSDLDATRAVELARASLKSSWTPLIEEPVKSGVTLLAVAALSVFGGDFVQRAMNLAANPSRIGASQ
ncbi:MAG: glycosyltransferase family 2 protein [Roseobacter sp.]